MPSLSLITNAVLSPEAESALADALSKTLASGLGKPEAYVMVSVQTGVAVRFGGSEEPAALMEVQSIGLPRDVNPVASPLTALVEKACGVSARRVYVNFTDIPADRWAQAGNTFA